VSPSTLFTSEVIVCDVARTNISLDSITATDNVLESQDININIHNPNNVHLTVSDNSGREIINASHDEPCPRGNIASAELNDNSQVCSTHSPVNNKYPLKLMVWNVQGLGDKLQDSTFLSNISNYDIIFFLETMKLDTFTPSTGNYIFRHFQRKFQHPRARKPAGGIGVLIRNDLYSQGVVSVVKNSDFTVWLKIKSENTNIFIAGVYIPPLDSTSTISNFRDNNAFHIIQDEITHFSQIGSVGLCGDFNARTGSLSDYVVLPGKDATDHILDTLTSSDHFPDLTRFSEDSKCNKYGKDLIKLCKSSSLRIMNGFFKGNRNTGTFTCYTARGKSQIDYLLCDHTLYQNLVDFNIEPLTTDSDHRSLVFSFYTMPPDNSQPPCSDQSRNAQFRNEARDRFFKYVFDPDAAAGAIASLSDVHCSALYDSFLEGVISDSGVDSVVNDMYTLLETAISGNFSRKFQKSAVNRFPRNEWFDNECKSLKRQTNEFAKNHDLNIEHNLDIYHDLKKFYKSTTQRKKREYQRKVRNELRDMNLGNPRDYWKYWDRIQQNSRTFVTASGITLECFEDYFTSVQSPPQSAVSHFDMQFFKDVEQFLEDYDKNLLNLDPFITDLPITVHEVEFELKSLKMGKAPGIDGIGNEFYKYLSDHILHPMTTLFNYVWDKGVYPIKWSEGIIQPLHKKGSQNEADNYRKLTMMACMGKIFESIMNRRMTFQSEATGSADPYQFGFTKSCRTSDNVFILDTIISHHKFKKKKLYVAFIDFSKAFDFVNRNFLYYKMISKGYGGKLLAIIRSLFSRSSARVRWQGELGTKIDSTFGVLQGGIISPKLFNLYLSDLNEYLDQGSGVTLNGQNFTHLLYADDLILLSESPQGMRTLLGNLDDYCMKWHLIVNSQKSKVMIFNNSKTNILLSNHDFVVSNERLEIVSSYKYLGHVICSSRNIHKMMHEHLATQAQKAMHALKQKVKSTVGHLYPSLNMKMFDTQVLPVLEYNSEIWFPEKEIADLEKVQLGFLKNMLGVRSQTSTIGVLLDTGRFPLLVRQHVSALKYLDRLKSPGCPTLLRHCFDIQMQLSQSGSPCWLTRLKKVVNSVDVCGTDVDLSKVGASLFEQTQRNMLDRMNDSTTNPKLRTYKLFKMDFRIEPYLNLNFPKTIYSYIARFRLSSHNLCIELGRHKRPFIPAEERICEKCNSGAVEDELHCLLLCEKWRDARKPLIDVAVQHIEGFLVLNQAEQFISILAAKTAEVIYALGKFLFVALQLEN